MKASFAIKWDLLVVRQIAVHALAYAQIVERMAKATIAEVDRMIEGRDPIVCFAEDLTSPVTSNEDILS